MKHLMNSQEQYFTSITMKDIKIDLTTLVLLNTELKPLKISYLNGGSPQKNSLIVFIYSDCIRSFRNCIRSLKSVG